MTAQSAGIPSGYTGPVTAGGQPGVAPPVGYAAPGQDFQMSVEDVFVIQGRGVVATGRVSAGRVSRGMPIVVYRAMQPVGSLTVVGVEMFRKQVDTAAARTSACCCRRPIGPRSSPATS